MNFRTMVPLCLAVAAMNAGAVMVVGDANTTTVVTPTSTTITVTNVAATATLTVTDPGEIEILLVGGGGGAGASASGTAGYNSGDSRGGGGGGGGVIHKTSFHVEAGSYPITVGAGGAINRSNDTIASATGGNTTGFGLTAFGGGPGGCVDPTTYYTSSSLVGASGGGGSKNSNGRSYPGGTALASAENENLGHNGVNAPDYKNAGGGGGAGAIGSGINGGDGYACDISGETVYYGGGGGGGSRYNPTVPGNGGGKASWGGGGSGQSAANTYPESGGNGIVIVRFTRTEKKATSDFKVSGYDAKKDLDGDYRCLVITNNTTLHVTGSATFDVLLVGGGGGAGANADNSATSCGGGGGGGGGVIHLRNIPVAAGDYAITVGAGGAVNTGVAATTVRGGDTTAFDFTAIGGGPGAKGSGYGPTIGDLGASGGGGATDGSSTEGSGIVYGGTVKVAAYNLGNAGADAPSYGSGYGLSAAYNSGGGGGAGAAANGVHGGDGYACDITGETVYYGGGGAGGQRDYSPADTPIAVAGLGGGKASWGGGGSGGYRYTRNAEAGGHGIVIIRYKRFVKGTTLYLR